MINAELLGNIWNSKYVWDLQPYPFSSLYGRGVALLDIGVHAAHGLYDVFSSVLVQVAKTVHQAARTVGCSKTRSTEWALCKQHAIALITQPLKALGVRIGMIGINALGLVVPEWGRTGRSLYRFSSPQMPPPFDEASPIHRQIDDIQELIGTRSAEEKRFFLMGQSHLNSQGGGSGVFKNPEEYINKVIALGRELQNPIDQREPEPDVLQKKGLEEMGGTPSPFHQDLALVGVGAPVSEQSEAGQGADAEKEPDGLPHDVFEQIEPVEVTLNNTSAQPVSENQQLTPEKKAMEAQAQRQLPGVSVSGQQQAGHSADATQDLDRMLNDAFAEMKRLNDSSAQEEKSMEPVLESIINCIPPEQRTFVAQLSRWAAAGSQPMERFWAVCDSINKGEPISPAMLSSMPEALKQSIKDQQKAMEAESEPIINCVPPEQRTFMEQLSEWAAEFSLPMEQFVGVCEAIHKGKPISPAMLSSMPEALKQSIKDLRAQTMPGGPSEGVVNSSREEADLSIADYLSRKPIDEKRYFRVGYYKTLKGETALGDCNTPEEVVDQLIEIGRAAFC